MGVEAAGVHRRTAVTQQQCTRVSFGLRLRDGLVEFDGAVRSQSDMAVRIDESRDDPAAVKDGLGAGDRFGAQNPVGDPPLNRFAIGQTPTPNMESRHSD